MSQFGGSANSKWSIQKRFENGTYKVSYPPYGYDWDGEQMVINAEQAAVVKEIFAALLSGKGTHAIADALNQRHSNQAKRTLDVYKYSRDAFLVCSGLPSRKRIHVLSGQ